MKSTGQGTESSTAELLSQVSRGSLSVFAFVFVSASFQVVKMPLVYEEFCQFRICLIVVVQ